MSRALLTLTADERRDQAIRWIRQAPDGTRVEFKRPKRTLPQNDRFWAMLTDVSTQIPYYGVWLHPDDWKLIFVAALKREMRMVPNLDGDGFVNLGTSSSDLSKEEMSDVIEMIFAYGAKHGVTFDEKDAA